jgi:hypothetical protein
MGHPNTRRATGFAVVILVRRGIANLLTPRNMRRLAGGLLALYAALAGAGLAIQIVEGAPAYGLPMPVHLLEAMLLSTWALVGALLVSRHPRHPVGWVWILLAISYALDHFAWGYAYHGFVTDPGSLPGVEVAIVMQYWLVRGTLGTIGWTLLFLLFPTGQSVSRRWGKVAWIAAGAVAVQVPVATMAPDPIGLFPFPTDILAAPDAARTVLDPLRELTVVAGLVCQVAAAFSLFTRLRRARGVERQQLKWFVYTASFLAPGIFLIVWGGTEPSTAPAWALPLGFVLGPGIGGMGTSIGSAVAILRYHLWDIDIIIRRTLAYSALTGVLALVYFGSVAALQAMFRTLAGQNSQLAIVVSTLAIAGLFNPLRIRLQSAIDRRFYRSKYDTAQTLAAFSASLREAMDLGQLADDLLDVVGQTMQPTHASLWLRQAARSRPGRPAPARARQAKA